MIVRGHFLFDTMIFISSLMEVFWDTLAMPFQPTVESVNEVIYEFRENFYDVF